MLLLPAGAFAQFNQSISVEGKYVPEIFRLDRINSFPQQVRFNLETNPLSYDSKSVPAGFSPSLIPLPATGWRSIKDFSDQRGYLELGAGSFLNSTLSAGYRFINSPETTVGIRLQHNSTSLWKPKMTSEDSDIKQFRYDESLGIFGSHEFDGIGRLNAALDWHIGYFNYYGTRVVGYGTEKDVVKAPSQTLNDVSLRVGWQSPTAYDDITWHAGAGIRYFGYRRFYNDNYNLDEIFIGVPSTRETDINVNGGVNFPLSTKSAVGIDANIDVITYGGYKDNTIMVGDITLPKPDSYSLITLTPYYSFSRDNMIVRVGADLDIAANAGPAADRYKAFHVAPDVRLDYQSGPAAFYLHLLGGTRHHTLASNYELDYYQMPFITNTAPIHSPLDGTLGMNFGPFHGFSAGLEVSYRITKGEYLGGWYQQYLNNHLITNPDLHPLPTTVDGKYVEYNLASPWRIDMHGISLGANLSLDLGKVFKLKAKANYQPQNGKTGYFNGYDRPRWIAEASAEINPWRSLKFSIGYQYRGVRNIYTIATAENAITLDDNYLVSSRLPDITYLNAGASYSFTKNFNIWIQADNLLNRRDEWLPSLPTQGVRILGGFGVTF